METNIFAPSVQSTLLGIYEQSRKAATQIPMLIGSACINALFALGVMLFEYEIMYRVFEHIAGEDSEYWSPKVMGLSSFILVVAVHYFAERDMQHTALRFVDKAAGMLVPVYLTGVGILLAVLLYRFGLGDMLDAGSAVFNPETMEMEGKAWLSVVMENIASPIAAILFSAGCAALCIINVFVAHKAIDKARTAKQKAVALKYALMVNKADMDIYLHAQMCVEDVTAKKTNLITTQPERLKIAVGSELLIKLQEANNVALSAVMNAQVLPEQDEFILPAQPKSNLKNIEKTVKAIQAISLATLIKHMN